MEKRELLDVIKAMDNYMDELAKINQGDSKEIQNELGRLRQSLVELSKEVTDNREEFITVREGYKHLLSDFQRVQEEIEEIQRKDDRSSDRRYQSVEKVVMIVVGAVVSYIFNLLNK